MQRILGIDIETYSELDLLEVGNYKYANHPSFEIMLFGFAFDDDPVQVIDFTAGESLPLEVWEALMDPQITKTTIKTAFNAQFERYCIARHLGQEMPPSQWRCSQVQALELGLPSGLKRVTEALGWPEEKKKLKEGKELIDFFCKPCKPTEKNGHRTRNLPQHYPGKWLIFKSYCGQDVEVERSLRKQLHAYQITPEEQLIWQVDQKINDRGVLLDEELITQAAKLDDLGKSLVKEEAKRLTGLLNPNSDSQMKKWVEEQIQIPVPSLNKTAIPQLLKKTDNPNVHRAIALRGEMKKTSNSKYHKMLEIACDDWRARGVLQFYGANRTGRWAGRLVQVQNLPRNKIKTLNEARSLLRAGKFKALSMFYDNVPVILSQLIRTAFIPKPGCLFYISDFSAIEARMIAWLAKEQWRMDVFNSHGKIYEASAAQMFHVPIETIAKGQANYSLRAKGKVAELALGYGGSTGALEAMGALDSGLTRQELKPLVKAWRDASPAITKLWWDVDSAAIEAIQYGRTTSTHGIQFYVQDGILFVALPSGRKLAYVNPTVEPGKRGRDQIHYWGMHQMKKKWMKLDTYGPKLVENIVQALSRDCLSFAMRNLEGFGYQITMHIHDEVVIEHDANNPSAVLDDISKLMAISPAWCPDLPLNADGFYSPYYKKD